MCGRIGLGELGLIVIVFIVIVFTLRSASPRQPSTRLSVRQRAGELRRLAALRDKGVLTEQEYEREKRRVLES